MSGNETYSLDYNGKLNINENDLMIKEGGGNTKSINERLNDINNSVDVKLNNLKTTILKTIYPVGSIYTSFNNTNPNSIFGFGTWEQIVNRFLYCSSSSGATGGEETHQLKINEIPSHDHRGHLHIYNYPNHGGDNFVAYSRGMTDTGSANEGRQGICFWGVDGDSVEMGLASNGSNGYHNNMPPYITCYAWRRTQ